MPKVVLILGLVSLFTDMATEMVYPILPLYVTTLGYGGLSLGLLEGSSEALLSLVRFYSGAFSDRKGRRVVFVRLGYFISAVTKIFYLGASLFWVFVARLGDRFGKGIRTAPRDALLAESRNSRDLGKIFGFHRAMDTLGAVLGPLLSIIYLSFEGFQLSYIFLLALIPGLIAVALTFALPKEKEKKKQDRRITLLAFAQKARADYWLLSANLWFLAMIHLSPAFPLLWFNVQGLHDQETVIFYLIYNLSYSLLAFPMGWLSDLYGKRRVLLSGIFFFFVAYVIWYKFHSYMAYLVGWLLYGLFSAMTEAIKKAWLSSFIPQEEKATGFGLFSMGEALFLLLGQGTVGFLWDYLGAQKALLWPLVGSVMAFCSIWFFTRKLAHN